MKSSRVYSILSIAVALTVYSYSDQSDAEESIELLIVPDAGEASVEAPIYESDQIEEKQVAAKMPSANQPKPQKPTQLSDNFPQNYEMLKGKILTPAASATNNGHGAHLSADFIYWYARQEGLAFATTGQISNATPISTAGRIAQGQRLYPEWRLQPGFKAGIGYQMDYDSWDLNLEYTWLHSKADNRATIGQDKLGFPLWEIRSLVQLGAQAAPENYLSEEASLNFATASWKLHFNEMHMGLGRSFFISPKITLRPSFGLKASWQSQRYNVRYTAVGAVDDLGLTDQGSAQELYKIYSKQTYWGLGLRFFLGSSWHFSKNWSIFGNFGLSPMWGQFVHDRHDRLDVTDVRVQGSPVNVVEDVEVINTKARTHTVSPVIEMAMGFHYDNYFSNDSMRFRIDIGWEEQHWLSQNAYSFSSSDDMYGSLVFQGLTIKARFDF